MKIKQIIIDVENSHIRVKFDDEHLQQLIGDCSQTWTASVECEPIQETEQQTEQQTEVSHGDMWQKNYETLESFIEEHGREPRMSEPPIGKWFQTQKAILRRNVKANSVSELTRSRIKLFANLGINLLPKTNRAEGAFSGTCGRERFDRNCLKLVKFMSNNIGEYGAIKLPNNKSEDPEERLIANWRRAEKSSLTKIGLDELKSLSEQDEAGYRYRRFVELGIKFKDTSELAKNIESIINE